MTHYEVLGVSRAATPEQIRAAYRRAARAPHPDRHGAASADRMAAVNEAWRVLGDPVRRERYDLGLRGSDPGPGTRAGSGAVADGAPRGSAPGGAPTGELSRFPWRFFTVIGVLAAAVVVIGNLTRDPVPPAPVDNVLVAGECVAIVDDATREVRPVSCDGSHDAVVDRVVGFDERCRTGTEGFRDPQGRGTACVTRVVPGV